MFIIDVEGINGKTETLYVEGEHSILTELENHNIVVDYNCRQGHCGCCILQLISGEVHHKDNLIDLSNDELLACRATPMSDIKISERGY
ncbi:MAG: 2Fe-2S iron-sulfur cluster binding domain-containing protein [Candidatus Thioglobus sp.]|jgi:ferredoxin/3-ketosteroid 9alpha-monooxygenase subunit B|uniref:2Fe-2S iron-sulfur cluster-binding protein n=1 Tax=Candidatus Thioglobus sp. TaxID=2026721 RepID=UPI0001BD383C|nr:2Fe-2S iron-sulfur cluster-binding protein [Candidatus Thioglobus sp.]EEZ79941.1 MAG: hypothetical protein Sup05_1096 [uncultured Candidatus Thioglobus sp.]MBT3186369.1 2Fe-2S iron-sulfur cluster binding domain-containing protein [Candidatus Thioglobus sp.]MBT3964888.1 2Fe-2S iron-sulfur cluster binding domain-containing protein [Candidatus Thioglobus sp.]MBT4315606.1 2Fe-2S iron-sulfur cluster binding domain-containing protein [Candidatus Thioglobus sp.]MBT4553770.1 2Fe-2S iron-sulfur clus